MLDYAARSGWTLEATPSFPILAFHGALRPLCSACWPLHALSLPGAWMAEPLACMEKGGQVSCLHATAAA